ncbi:MAG TPA: hypothetical protein VGN79_12430 [Devosia sp.]|jgi:hypothetical protein|nr:hypothetical protein [Devosia sp.]
MQKAGGIIAIIAGVFGVFAAGITLLVGGISTAMEAEGGNTVVALGWGGVAFSFLCIVFGSVAIGARSKWPGSLLILSAAAGAILGGTLVAVFMALAFIGGVLALFTKKQPVTPMVSA